MKVLCFLKLLELLFQLSQGSWEVFVAKLFVRWILHCPSKEPQGLGRTKFNNMWVQLILRMKLMSRYLSKLNLCWRILCLSFCWIRIFFLLVIAFVGFRCKTLQFVIFWRVVLKTFLPIFSSHSGYFPKAYSVIMAGFAQIMTAKRSQAAQFAVFTYSQIFSIRIFWSTLSTRWSSVRWRFS